MGVRKIVVAGLLGSCVLAAAGCGRDASVEQSAAVVQELAELKNEIGRLAQRLDTLEKRTTPFSIDLKRPVRAKSRWLDIERGMKIDELEQMDTSMPLLDGVGIPGRRLELRNSFEILK